MRFPSLALFAAAAPSICRFLAVVVLAGIAHASGAGEPKFSPLFNGKDLTGWKVPSPNPYWRVEHGVLIGESDAAMTGSTLWTEKSYCDFVFETDVRWEGDPDSGVFFRTPALQVQIGTSISQKRDLTGSFYLKGYPEHAQAKDAAKYLKKGDWNTLRVEARGTTFKVSINGHPVSHYSDPAYAAAGPIGVQIHQKLKMKVEFRNLRVAELR
jgi:hypothetical protein